MGLSVISVTGVDELDDDSKQRIIRGDYQIVFFTPEKIIESSFWRKMLKSDIYMDRLKALVIDEAHCIPKWYTKLYLLHTKHFMSLLWLECVGEKPFDQLYSD